MRRADTTTLASPKNCYVFYDPYYEELLKRKRMYEIQAAEKLKNSAKDQPRIEEVNTPITTPYSVLAAFGSILPPATSAEAQNQGGSSAPSSQFQSESSTPAVAPIDEVSITKANAQRDREEQLLAEIGSLKAAIAKMRRNSTSNPSTELAEANARILANDRLIKSLYTEIDRNKARVTEVTERELRRSKELDALRRKLASKESSPKEATVPLAQFKELEMKYLNAVAMIDQLNWKLNEFPSADSASNYSRTSSSVAPFIIVPSDV